MIWPFRKRSTVIIRHLGDAKCGKVPWSGRFPITKWYDSLDYVLVLCPGGKINYDYSWEPYQDPTGKLMELYKQEVRR
jgi:hypothetical protein